MIRKLTVTVIVLLLLSPAVLAQRVSVVELPADDRVAIERVIVLQLAALRHDEAELAFSYVSPLLRHHVGTAENFLDMVKSDYRAVYRPRDVVFLALEATWRGPVQMVFFFDPDGDPVIGRYFMQKQEDGSWKINGCQLIFTLGQGI